MKQAVRTRDGLMTPEAAETPPVEIENASQPDACVIWLHGLGADGHDFEGIVPALQLPAALAVRFVFPHAPYRPVTLNGGCVMRAWYDIALTDGGFTQNEADIRASVGLLEARIRREIERGIQPGRIVLAGFSQGGAIALHTGLRHPERLAGILALSVPVPFVDRLLDEAHPANAHVPVFLGHGTEDPMVPFTAAQSAYQRMAHRGRKIDWHTYPMGHTVIPDEIIDIGRWLTDILAGQS